MSGLGRAARPGLFLSTLSLRRATLSNNSRRFVCLHFYPRSPCGERHPPSQSRYADTNFYPRSPCGERLSSISLSYNAENFYPRSPCGERRHRFWHFCVFTGISIHALLAESDSVAYILSIVRYISIHALLAESDPCRWRGGHRQPDFYPRSPCGERQRCIYLEYR